MLGSNFCPYQKTLCGNPKCDADIFYYPFDRHSCSWDILSGLNVEYTVMQAMNYEYTLQADTNKEWIIK